MKTISYKGKLANGDIDSLALHTLKGKIGYKVVKFNVIGVDPRGSGSEGVVKIYSVKQTSADDKIDFTDSTLLGCAFYENNSSQNYFGGTSIVFDNMMFNQDYFLLLVLQMMQLIIILN